MKLKLADDLSLPADAITQTFAILAKRRTGKTYTASVMAEEFVKAKLPFVALDPTGAWWGLRASADGKAGYPVIIIGGEHGDVPLEAAAGKIVADLVVEHPGYYVIDLSATQSNAEQDRFVADFAERLYRKKADRRDPLHLFIDEADSFAPQRPLPGQQRMLGSIEAIIRRGGIRGLGATLITQRPAVLNKNVLTQVEVLVVLQITAPQDRAAIDEWVKGNGTKEQRDELVNSLASLGKGDTWFWSPSWLDIFKRVHIRARETFNSSATPESGRAVVAPRRLADVDLNALRTRMAATIEQAKATDPKLLQKRVTDLERLLQQAQAAKPEVQRIEVPAILPADLTALNALIQHAEQIAGALRGIADQFTTQWTVIQDSFRAAATRSPIIPQRNPARLAVTHMTPPTAISSNLSKAERAILTALAQYPGGKSQRQVAVLAGYAWKGGGFNNALSRCKVQGWITGSKERYQITGAGIDALGDWTPLPAGRALAAYWLAQLPQAQRAILQTLIDAYPAALDKVTLAQRAGVLAGKTDGYEPGGGGFNNALSRLRTLDLVQGRNELRASDILFEKETL